MRRAALVTGGTRGIGLGIARALAQRGWDVAICGLRPAADVVGVIEELTATGARAHYCQADVASADDRSRLVADVQAWSGGVTALVNNAGRGPRVRADLLDATEDSFDEILGINLRGPYFLTQAIARDMVTRRAADATFTGTIVFVTSVSAEMVSTTRGEYCVSKAGLAMASKLFAARLADQGVSVFEVRPGIIETDMTAGVREHYDRRIADGLVPEGRWGLPEDVGRAVAALVNGEFPHATGTVVHIDGGLSVPRL